VEKGGKTMTEKIFHIPNITCGHCVRSIQNELTEIAGVKQVSGDPAKKTVSVEWDHPATEDAIRKVLKEINYPAE
jgi:copper chaperone